MSFNRSNGRGFSDLRPVKLNYDVYGYADASLLLELGNTKVMVSVSLQQSVPQFLKGQRVGWLSAEYAMLPCATQQRTQRESSGAQRNARSVEISRLIGRCLRTVVDLNQIGERSIIVDCDVLQADGGTRVACITAASLALELAIQRWVSANILDGNVFKESIAAISVGVLGDKELVDLDFNEDSSADADFNFVMTGSGNLVEIQGTCEKKTISASQFDALKGMATTSIQQFIVECKKTIPSVKFVQSSAAPKPYSNNGYAQKGGMFSLGSRISKTS